MRGLRLAQADRLAAGRLEVRVRAGEMAAREKPARSAVRGGVSRRQDVVARRIDPRSLLLRVPTPELEDYPHAACRELVDRPVGEALPTLPRVRRRLPGGDGQDRVEQEDAPLRPRGQVARRRTGELEVA